MSSLGRNTEENHHSRRVMIVWVCITVMIMFVMPFAVAEFASESAGMALCMMLFLVINPLYSIILGVVSGKNIKVLWNLPVISAVAFLSGTWLFFDRQEPWFMAYAAVYLCIGVITMLITNHIRQK